MNRVIKFRGKDNGHWVYGDYIEGGYYDPEVGCNTYQYYIISDFPHNVNPDTVGQFTGLHDKNGKEIYEGDIVTMKQTPKGRSMCVTSRYVVTSHSVTDWDFHSLVKEILSFSMCNFHEEYSIYNHRVEVIGNIHDNPELAKPYSLNLPAPKQRKKRNKGFQVEFVVSDNPRPEPHVEDNKLIYEVTQEEMNEAIRSQLKESNKQ